MKLHLAFGDHRDKTLVNIRNRGDTTTRVKRMAKVKKMVE